MCIQDILGTPLDYDKARKHMEDAKLELGDVKIVVAIIAFFITNAAKNGVDENTLAEELQQLGLPKGERTPPPPPSPLPSPPLPPSRSPSALSLSRSSSSRS
jgi:hypothetical protein